VKSFFAVVFLFALAGLPSALFIVASNTTINSSITQNETFFLFATACIFDLNLNLSFCGLNQTYYIVENKTQYFNSTIYPIPINNTIYPQCASFANETRKLAFADFGVAPSLNYSCNSGELVEAPDFPNATRYVEVPSNASITINSTLPNPFKLQKVLDCADEVDREKGFTFVDFTAQQYVDLGVKNCEVKKNLTEQELTLECKPFYEKGKDDRVCPSAPQPAPTTAQAAGNDAPVWIFLFLAFVYGAFSIWKGWEGRKVLTHENVEKEIL